MAETKTADLLVAHLPVLLLLPDGSVRTAGCTCGADPLDHTEHLANTLERAGVCDSTALLRQVEALSEELAAAKRLLEAPECEFPDCRDPAPDDRMCGLHRGVRVSDWEGSEVDDRHTDGGHG